MPATTFQRAQHQGMRIHVLPSDRFKTYAVSLYIGSPLSGETVTANALIPFVLRRGTARYPETVAFREKLDELYGAGFGFDVYKRGNNHIVQFRMDTIADRYIGEQRGLLLQETLTFLLQAVTQPATKNGAFLEKYVNTEKTTQRKKLEAVINDKIRYAAERCTQEMFADDPFRFHALGRIDQIEAWQADSLYAYYQDWLASSQMDLYVVGDTSMDEVLAVINEAVPANRKEPIPYQFGEAIPLRSEPKLVTEHMDVSQGKLNMGLSVPVFYQDDAYPDAMVYNGILGGYPHAKLFANVREKASLAYYVSSRLDGYKGMLMIQSGIEVSNYDKAVSIIKAQLEAMASGQISDVELTQTQAMMTNQLREIGDSAFDMIAYDFNSVMTGTTRTIPELIEQIGQVTKERVAQIAKQVQLDTIYFLSDRKGE